MHPSSGPEGRVNPPYFWDASIWESFFGSTSAGRGEASAVAREPPLTPAAPLSPSHKAAAALPPPVSPRTSELPARQQPPPPLNLDDYQTYTVGLDESFDSIALKHNMSAVELRRANPGVPFGSAAVPGQELHVKKPRPKLPPPPHRVIPATTRTPKPNHEDKSGVQKDALLCVAEGERVPGRLIVGVSSGFVLFEPSDLAAHANLVFALDRGDIIGCASISHVSSRALSLDAGTAAPASGGSHAGHRVYLQVVWRNPDLGFATEQQVFFEVAMPDAACLIEAVYADNPDRKKRARTMTSGVVALRFLSELKLPMSSEMLMQAEDGGGEHPEEPPLAAPAMFPRDSRILSERHLIHLAQAVPERLRGSAWRLLWDFDEGGVSLHALYGACRGQQESLLIVQDVETGAVCGIFANEPWDPSRAQTGFFGSGECFVFAAESEHADIGVYRWSGANDFLLSCSAMHVGIGGGGAFALCLDEDLVNATCGPSATFAGLEHKSLVKSPFRIGQMELWGFELFAPRSSSLSLRSGSISFSAADDVAAAAGGT